MYMNPAAVIDNPIEDPYTLDQLTSPRVNTLVVRPLVDRLYDPDDMSIGLLFRTPLLVPYFCKSLRICWTMSISMFLYLSQRRVSMKETNPDVLAHMMG